jgi:hypothetical protein
MLTIQGDWTFHSSCPEQFLRIPQLGPAGQLVESFVDDQPITGAFDASTNAITFNDTPTPGEVLGVKFFTGFVAAQADAVCYMAGTYHELILSGLPPRGPLTFRTATYSWYATYQGVPTD